MTITEDGLIAKFPPLSLVNSSHGFKLLAVPPPTNTRNTNSWSFLKFFLKALLS